MTKATIKTSLGEIKLELNDEKAPITVENFKTIANRSEERRVGKECER